jgi:hypothetical protein
MTQADAPYGAAAIAGIPDAMAAAARAAEDVIRSGDVLNEADRASERSAA